MRDTSEIIEYGRDLIANRPGARFAIVNAVCVTRRAKPHISINRYELRACSLAGSFYKRKRLNGDNPVTLASTTSGTGAPKWMLRACAELNRATK